MTGKTCCAHGKQTIHKYLKCYLGSLAENNNKRCWFHEGIILKVLAGAQVPGVLVSP